MTFYELAKQRYSVRSFKNNMIEEEKLKKILEVGLSAPTACNRQPQKIFVIKRAELREKLKGVCRFTFDAPVILVVGYDRTRDWKNRLMQGYSSGETDAAIVCTHMMLEAWELGIGSCWVGYFNADDVSRALDLPEGVQITAMLPLGYPSEDCTPLDLHFESRTLDDTVTEL